MTRASAARAYASSSETRSNSGAVEVWLVQRQRLLGAHTGSPQHHDQGTQPASVRPIAGDAHNGDDLLDPWPIGRIARTFVARWPLGTEPPPAWP
jgi:hypothetical protein